MIKGTIKAIHDIQDIPNTEYQKRVFAITNSEGYQGREQIFAFELFGDNMNLISKFKEGDEVTVSYNTKCRHWKEDKYFTTLDAWKITGAGAKGYSIDSSGDVEETDASSLPF